MTTGEIIFAAFMTFWSAAISALVWGTYRRLDHRIDGLEERMDAQSASMRADLTQVALAIGAARPPRASEG